MASSGHQGGQPGYVSGSLRPVNRGPRTVGPQDLLAWSKWVTSVIRYTGSPDQHNPRPSDLVRMDGEEFGRPMREDCIRYHLHHPIPEGSEVLAMIVSGEPRLSWVACPPDPVTGWVEYKVAAQPSRHQGRPRRSRR